MDKSAGAIFFLLILLGAGMIAMLFTGNSLTALMLIGAIFIGLFVKWEHLAYLHLLLSPLIPGYIQLSLQFDWRFAERAILPTDLLFVTLFLKSISKIFGERHLSVVKPTMIKLHYVWMGLIIYAAVRGVMFWPETAFESIRNYSVYLLLVPAVAILADEAHVPRLLRFLLVMGIMLLPVSVAASMYMYSIGEWVIGPGFSRPEKYLSGSVFLYTFVVALFQLRMQVLKFPKLFTYVALICSVAGILLSYTRSLWIAAALSVLMVGLMSPRGRSTFRNFTFLGVIGALLVGIYMMIANQGITLTERATGGNIEEEYLRVAEYRVIPDLIFSSMDTAFLGRGLGATINYEFLEVSVPYVHNNYLNVLNTTGLVGLLIFTMLFVAYLRTTLRVRKHHADRPEVFMLTGVTFTLLVGLLVESVFAGQITSARTTPALIFLLALVYRQARQINIGLTRRPEFERVPMVAPDSIKPAGQHVPN